MDARLSYREAAVRGATPVGLVILLYEQAIEDLRRAIAALASGDIQTRSAYINHAIVVLGQLQATLDMDLGGEVARKLNGFYDVIRAGLLQAQASQSADLLERQLTYLMEVREAWAEVARSEVVPQTPGPAPAGSAPELRAAEWKA